jgi:glycosyltransferase involved in cell wall biosynthesis
MPILSVIILTRDEEIHIERAIRSVATIAAKIFVVDSFSTDRTCEIARSLGAYVVQHDFITQSHQFEWAMRVLQIETEWVMRLDADEILTDQLKSEIAEQLPKLPRDISGVYLRLAYVFMSRKVVHGGRSLKLLRIFRKGAARVSRRWMDERIVLTEGTAATFNNMMFDHNLKTITFFIDKHNSYATREAVETLRSKYSLFGSEIQSTDEDISRKELKYRLKRSIYDRIPYWIGSLGFFVYRYFFKLGFLDGKEGLAYHFLQGYWYRFLVGAKVEEFDRVLRELPTNKARRAELARLSGFPSIATLGMEDG